MSKEKKYDGYKDTTIIGLNKVPSHWTESKFRYVTTVLTDYTANGSFKSLADNVQYLNEPDYARLIRLTDLRLNLCSDGIFVNKNSYDFLKKSALFGGEYLIANVGAYAGLVIQMPKYNGKATLGPNMMMAKFDEKKVLVKFMVYISNSDYIQKQLSLKANASSAQPKLNKEDIRSVHFIYPNIDEQKNIIGYLDKKCSQIDSVIDEKKRLVSLLEEKRQSMITDVVTKGLNPRMKMKDSGVEWIGEIPEHWEIKCLKYTIQINPSKSEIDLNSNQKVTFLPMENILEPGRVDLSLEKDLAEVSSGYTYFKNQDIVLAKVTPCFENGNIAIVDNLLNGIGFGTTELHVLRVKKGHYNRFYFYLVQSERFKQEGVSTMYGVGGLKRIPTEFVSNYKFAAPPLVEQVEIANYLDVQCARISDLLRYINQQIEKLKEYRQSLIYEAVTGKIDVRDFEVVS